LLKQFRHVVPAKQGCAAHFDFDRLYFFNLAELSVSGFLSYLLELSLIFVVNSELNIVLLQLLGPLLKPDSQFVHKLEGFLLVRHVSHNLDFFDLFIKIIEHQCLLVYQLNL
jgi:hypothetical protein